MLLTEVRRPRLYFRFLFVHVLYCLLRPSVLRGQSISDPLQNIPLHIPVKRILLCVAYTTSFLLFVQLLYTSILLPGRHVVCERLGVSVSCVLLSPNV
jgi:hypothetical protein